MAVIRGFELKTLERGGVHPTTVDCEWAVFERNGKRLLQLDTYGSDDRKDKGTVSCVRREEERLAGLVALLASEVTSIARPGFSQRSTEIARFH